MRSKFSEGEWREDKDHATTQKPINSVPAPVAGYIDALGKIIYFFETVLSLVKLDIHNNVLPYSIRILHRSN